MAQYVIASNTQIKALLQTATPAKFTVSGALQGAPGIPGTNGHGVIAGGATGQLLAKLSGADYDTQWITVVSDTTPYVTVGYSKADYITNGTNSQTQIQAAMDALAPSLGGSGGTVMLKAGVYNANGMTWRKGVSLIGAGRGITFLVLENAASTPTLLLTENFATFTSGFDDSWNGNSYMELSHMSINGNQINQNPATVVSDWRQNNALVKIYGYHFSLRELDIYNALELGLYTEHAAQWDDTFNQYQFGESEYDALYIKNYGLAGWVNRGPHDSYIGNVIISSYNAGGTDAEYGYIQQGNSTDNYGSSGMVVGNLHVWGQHSQNAIYIDRSNIISGHVYAEGCSAAAIKIVNANQNRFDAFVGYAPVGVELFGSSAENSISVAVDTAITGALFQLDGGVAGNRLELISGQPDGYIFDLNTGSYTGGNNTLIANHPYQATGLILGTVSISDKVEARNDAYPLTGALTRWELPVGASKVMFTNLGGTGRLDMGGLTIQNLGTPVNSTDAATKGYVDSHIAVNVLTYGAKGNAQTYANVTSTSAGTTVTLTGASPFTSADVGKLVVVHNEDGGTIGAITTIAAVNSSTSIRLTANAGATFSGNGYITYGNDDSSAIQSALTAAGNLVANYLNYATGFVEVYAPGFGPQSGYIIASQLTVPTGVKVNFKGAVYNMLPSRNTYCMKFSARSHLMDLNLYAMYGTGAIFGPGAGVRDYANITIGRYVCYFAQGSSTTPTSLTATPSGSGGTLAAGTYYYVVTGIDSTGGESLVSNEVTATTTGTTSSVALSWTGNAAFSTYRVYRGTVSRGQVAYYAVSGTSYTDTNATPVALPPVPCGTAAHLNGYHYEIGQITVKNATMGVFLGSTDTFANVLDLIGCATPMRGWQAGNISVPNIILDTCGATSPNGYVSEGGVIFDQSCSSINGTMRCFQTFSTTLAKHLVIGGYSTLTNGSIDFTVISDNVGGTMLTLSNASNSKFKLIGDSVVYPGSSSLPVVSGVTYGTGNINNIQVEAVLDTTITPYVGTPYGRLEYSQGGTKVAVGSASGTSLVSLNLANASTTASSPVSIKMTTDEGDGFRQRSLIQSQLDGSNGGLISFWTRLAGTISERMRISASGNVGIGKTAPTAVLHLKAGTSVAGTAPLKVDAGTLLGTAEAGAIELDGTSMYFTDGALARHKLAPTDSPTFTGTVTVPTPVNPTDASTKAYVDAVAQGLSIKDSVQLTTAAALPTNTYLSGVITITTTGVLTVDGVAVALNDRILVKNEVAAANNGIYVCTTAGAIGVSAVLTRAADSTTGAQILGEFAFTEKGTVNAAAGFVNTNSTAPTVGTTSITYTQFSGAGEITAGTGITITGNTIAVDETVIVPYSGATSSLDLGAHSLTARTFLPHAVTDLGGSTTPSVSAGNVFTVTNGSSETITNFTGGTAGQVITLVFLDANTTISNNSNIELNGGASYNPGLNATLIMVLDGSGLWHEVGRGGSNSGAITGTGSANNLALWTSSGNLTYVPQWPIQLDVGLEVI